MTNITVGRRIPRGLEIALFIVALLWAGAAHTIAGRAAAGISGRLGLVYGQNLLQSAFLLFLVVVGFQGLGWSARRAAAGADALPLPRRKTWLAEWGTGLAVGWGLCLAGVLPLLLAGDFHSILNRGPGLVPSVLVSGATLLVLTLAEEAIFRGYPFQRLTNVVGATFASLLMALLFGFVLLRPNDSANLTQILVNSTLFGVLLAIAYLRTHGLWLGWGLHFGYRVVTAVVLGLPIAGRIDLGSLLSATTNGPGWLSGGEYGLDAALLTSGLMLVTMVFLYRITRDWAWAYTLPEIRPAGYEVVVAPPAAHIAMEKSTLVAPPPLVQILPATSETFSAVPPPPRPDTQQ
jgi:membrane protease YdiL (CAAX protease family)